MKNSLFGNHALNRVIDRRRFLEVMALITGAAASGLLGCDNDAPEPSPKDVGSPDADASVPDAFVDDTPTDADELFAAVQRALRESPDHAPARAAALVASADVAGLLTFVRDAIQTYPTRHNYMANSTQEQRWGWQATLRGAAGTPREKAELLAELYRQAGFEAEVFAARLESPPTDWRSWLLRSERPVFSPAITDDQRVRWGTAFGADLSSGTQIDGEGTDAQTLADELLEQVDPSWFGNRSFDFRAADLWPVVRLKRDRIVQIANLWDPAATLTAPRIRPDDLDRSALEPSPLARVELVLEATLSDALASPIELVRGDWSFAEVIGRQLILKLDPALTLEQAAQTAIKDVTTFVPLMVWQGANLSIEDATQMSVVGEARLNTGAKVEMEGQRLRLDGTLVEGPELPPGNALDVTRLEIRRVNASCFPQILVEATAYDAQNNVVEGLNARDFVLTEDGAGQAATLCSNARRPRIIVLADDSGSMPPEFRGDAGAAFAADLLAKLKTENPLAEIEFRKTSSDIFAEVAAASRKGPTLVIYLTDGDVSDALTPEIETVLRQGPPVVAISVYARLDTDLQQIADLSGGAQFLISEVDVAVAKSAEFVGQQSMASYLIRYTAPHVGPTTRSVALGVPATAAAGEGNYEVPATPALPPRIVGLTLRVKTSHDTWGAHEHAVHLAGYLSANAVTVPRWEHANAVRDWCFGTHILAFEGAAPPRSVSLDDYLDAKLSTRALRDAAKSGMNLELREAWDAGFRVIPAQLFTSQAPLTDFSSAERLAFEDGLRVTMYSQIPEIGTNRIRRRLDIMPTSRISVVTEKNGIEQIREVFEITGAQAMAEAAMFTTSSRSQLQGLPVFAVPRGTLNPFSNHSDAALRSRWDAISDLNASWVNIYPEDPRVHAWWSVDPETGALCGRIFGGLGGGDAAAEIERQIEEINAVLDHVNEMVLLGADKLPAMGGFSLGVVALYGQLLVRLYGAVAITIAVLDASMLADRVSRALLIFACEVMESALTSAAGRLGEMWESVQKVLSLLTIEVPGTCPND